MEDEADQWAVRLEAHGASLQSEADFACYWTVELQQYKTWSSSL
jgi:hypothetical protein